MTVEARVRVGGIGAERLIGRLNPRGRLGHYACPDGRGRVVRAALVGEGKPPRRAIVECPHCGERHEAAITWRSPTAYDEGREPEVLIEAVPRARSQS